MAFPAGRRTAVARRRRRSPSAAGRPAFTPTWTTWNGAASCWPRPRMRRRSCRCGPRGRARSRPWRRPRPEPAGCWRHARQHCLPGCCPSAQRPTCCTWACGPRPRPTGVRRPPPSALSSSWPAVPPSSPPRCWPSPTSRSRSRSRNWPSRLLQRSSWDCSGLCPWDSGWDSGWPRTSPAMRPGMKASAVPCPGRNACGHCSRCWVRAPGSSRSVRCEPRRRSPWPTSGMRRGRPRARGPSPTSCPTWTWPARPSQGPCRSRRSPRVAREIPRQYGSFPSRGPRPGISRTRAAGPPTPGTWAATPRRWPWTPST